MTPLFFESVNNGAFLHCMLAAGLTLLVLDVFICTEFLSWLALALFAAWGTWLLALPLQWSALVFICFLALGFAFYYLLWVRAVRPFVMGVVLRHAPAEYDSRLVGQHGTIRGAGETLCVRTGDQLFPVAVHSRSGLQEGDAVTITAFADGYVTVRKAE